MTTSKLDRLVLLSIFAVLFTIYILSAAKVPTGYADSDELITTSYLLSVAHPPGYGLIIYLIHLFQKITPFLNPAHSANIFAGLCHALTMVFIGATAILVTQNQHLSSSRYRISLIGILTGTITGGLSALFWLYSSVIEVMSLGDLLVALIIYLATKWYYSVKPDHVVLTLTSFIIGLSISHLQSIILLLPGLIYLMYLKKKFDLILLAIPSTLFGFIAGSFLIIPLNNGSPTFSWDFPQTFSGWWHMITRGDYQGFLLHQNQAVPNPYLINFSFEKIRAIPLYLGSLINQYGGILLFLPLLGVILLYKNHKLYARSILLMYVFSGLLFGLYATITRYLPSDMEYRLIQGISERQYLIGFTIISLFIVYGTSQLLLFLYSFLSRPITRFIVIITYATIIPLSLYLANLNVGNQSGESTAYQYSKDLLDTAKPGSVIICSGDISCYSLMYRSLVEKYRPDVTVISSSLHMRKYFLQNHPEYVGFIYPDEPYFSAQLISWNVSSRPTYLTDYDSFFSNYLGFEGNPFYLSPEGRLFQIMTTYPVTTKSDIKDNNLTSLLTNHPDNRNLFRLGLLDFYASKYYLSAQLFTRLGDQLNAKSHLETAITLNSTDPMTINWLVKLSELSQTTKYKLNPPQAVSDILNESANYVSQNQKDKAYDLLRKGSYLYPTSPEICTALYNLYLSSGYQELANTEKSRLLTLTR